MDVGLHRYDINGSDSITHAPDLVRDAVEGVIAIQLDVEQDHFIADPLDAEIETLDERRVPVDEIRTGLEPKRVRGEIHACLNLLRRCGADCAANGRTASQKSIFGFWADSLYANLRFGASSHIIAIYTPLSRAEYAIHSFSLSFIPILRSESPATTSE